MWGPLGGGPRVKELFESPLFRNCIGGDDFGDGVSWVSGDFENEGVPCDIASVDFGGSGTSFVERLLESVSNAYPLGAFGDGMEAEVCLGEGVEWVWGDGNHLGKRGV